MNNDNLTISNKNIWTREITIKNFKNIGIDQAQTMQINHFLERENPFNVIPIIGVNNSGKSNI